MRRVGSAYVQWNGRQVLLYSLMYCRSFFARSGTEVKTPRRIIAREIFANQSST